jgi:phosphatidylserine/phosphatidylglycerophosphate/cardiolipin synthase-like enzyme
MQLQAAIRIALVLVVLSPLSARADEWCEPAFQNCRDVMLRYVNGEAVRLDVAVESIKEDSFLVDAIIARFRAGVPVRMIVEPRADTPLAVLEKLKAAGIPMRRKATGSLLHWKMFVFTGQQVVEFAATNFTQSYLVPVKPYANFTQDATYFSDDLAILRSFQRKFEDAWVDPTGFVNYANVSTPTRVYGLYPIDPSLNFVPSENFSTRSKPLYDAETRKIDVTMYKITEGSHVDGLIRAVKRGIPVRLIVEPSRYRNRANVWQAYHIDRMYAAKISIRERAHLGFMHQKTTLLYAQGMAVFGSSNWTTESNKSQYEHNYFSTKPAFFEFLRQVFERKWTTAETKPFVPLPPDPPVYVAPINTSSGQPVTVTLSWKTGPWSHKADVYFGTSSTPPLFKANVAGGPSATAKFTVTGLAPGATYFWRIVSKTLAGKTAAGPVWSFGT